MTDLADDTLIGTDAAVQVLSQAPIGELADELSKSLAILESDVELRLKYAIFVGEELRALGVLASGPGVDRVLLEVFSERFAIFERVADVEAELRASAGQSSKTLG